MSNSSDSELELAQRSQPQSKTSKQEAKNSSNVKSPWDMMKSKQNKAFSKNYLQEMMNLNEPNSDVFKSTARPNEISNKQRSVNKIVEDPEKSPGMNKRVSFNEQVQKREIEVPSSSSESSEDDENEIKKKEKIEKNDDIDSDITSDDASLEDQMKKQKDVNRITKVVRDSSSELKKINVSSTEKSKFAVTKGLNLNKINNKNVKSKEKINCTSQNVSDFENESSGKEFIESPKKMIPIKNIKKEQLSSQSDSDRGSTVFPIKRLKLNNIKKESSDSDSKPEIKPKRNNSNKNSTSKRNYSTSEESSDSETEVTKNIEGEDSESDSESVSENDLENKSLKKKVVLNKSLNRENYNKNKSPNKSFSSLNKNSSLTKSGPIKDNSKNDSSESDSEDETMKKKVVSNKNISDDESSDDEEKNRSTIKVRNSSSLIKGGQNLMENESSESDVSDEINSNRNVSNKRNVSIKRNVSNKRNALNIQKNIKNESSSESDQEMIGNVSTLAKICALNSNKSKSEDDTIDEKPFNKKNKYLMKKEENYVELNNLKRIETKTYNLLREIRKGGNKIFLARIPKELDPKQFLKSAINFRDEPSTLEIENNVYTINVNVDDNISNVLIADSCKNDDSFNVLSLKPRGFISICKENKIRRKSLKIKKHQENEVIEEPKNLKEHHLLLGRDYEDRINLDKWISDKLDGLITDFNKKQKQKRRSKSIEKKKSLSETPAENLDIFKLLDNHSEQQSLDENHENEFHINKKKKKKKIVDESEIKPKIKSEMEESIDIINQMMLENVDNETKKPAKRKRTKSTFEDKEKDDEENFFTKRKTKSLTTFDDEDDSNKSKKNKKSKSSLEHIVKEEILFDDEVSPKKNKKKTIVNSTMISPKEDNSIFDNEESVIPTVNESSLNSFVDGLMEEVEDKKKKRKRNSLGDVTGTSLDLKKKKKSL